MGTIGSGKGKGEKNLLVPPGDQKLGVRPQAAQNISSA
jgi:hypothetical protein